MCLPASVSLSLTRTHIHTQTHFTEVVPSLNSGLGMMHLGLRVYRVCLSVCQPSVLSGTVPTLSARCGPLCFRVKLRLLRLYYQTRWQHYLVIKILRKLAVPVGRVRRELGSLPLFCRCCSWKRQPGLPWWLSGKESVCSAGGLGSNPGRGRSPGEGNGHPPQHSYLENSMDRGAWWAVVHGAHKESHMTERLIHTYTHIHTHTYIHTHIYTQTHPYTHIHTRGSRVWMF